MRGVVVVSVALLGGCFTELPAMPGTGSDATAGTASSGGTASGTGDAGTSGQMSAPASATDADPPTTGGTTGEPSAAEGLFKCVKAPACGLWDCAGGCDAPDAAGTCVLTALRDRMSGALQVSHCDTECAVHLLMPRGSGTDEVQWQWQVQTEPATYSEVRRCTLRPPQFFADCLLNFGTDCADPSAWVVDCATAEPMCVS